MSRIEAGDGDSRHGTQNGYVNLSCRCQPCKDAWAASIRQMKAKRVPPPEGDPRHGRPSTYSNYDCRCELCRAAATARSRLQPSRYTGHVRHVAKLRELHSAYQARLAEIEIELKRYEDEP